MIPRATYYMRVVALIEALYGLPVADPHAVDLEISAHYLSKATALACALRIGEIYALKVLPSALMLLEKALL